MVLQPNLVSGCTLIPTFSVPNWIMHFCFITTFTPLRKEEENKREKRKKTQETKPIFEGSTYLRNAGSDLVEI